MVKLPGGAERGIDMKLNEKIYQCRRKAGLSQEALAEKIGVSRQAISKWETGEASPEISKLPLLAKEFGVTADWLLSEEDEAAEEDAPADEAPVEDAESPRSESPPRRQYSDEPVSAVPGWLEHLPGFLVRMIRKYGWLVGVRIAIGGAITTVMGFVAKAMFGSMANYAQQEMNSLGGGLFGGSTGLTFYDNAGNVVDPSHFGLSANDVSTLFGVDTGINTLNVTSAMPEPFSIFCNFIIFVGLVTLIGGALLAWWLKKKGMEA